MVEIESPISSCDDALRSAIREMDGQVCCCQRVGEYRSLRLGFGRKISRSMMAVRDPFFGEWQIGTYSAAWRIVSEERILLGSMELAESSADLDDALQEIDFGSLKNIETVSRFCVRVYLDGGVYIDFMAASTEGAALFFLLKPDTNDLEYHPTDGWTHA